MTDSIITYFPQAFYVAENLLEPGYLKELQDKVYRIKDGHPSGGSNWVLRPYNTLDTYELINDPTFNTLLNKIEEKLLHLIKNITLIIVTKLKNLG